MQLEPHNRVPDYPDVDDSEVDIQGYEDGPPMSSGGYTSDMEPLAEDDNEEEDEEDHQPRPARYVS